jgi:cardiolipin synthase
MASPEGWSEATRETTPEGWSEATRQTTPEGQRGLAAQAPSSQTRVMTVPNALSAVRLALVPVFLYVLLVSHADAWAVGILMFTGASDWADGKIARLANQSSRLGELLDPLVDRIYMIAIPIAFALRGFVPWWIVAVLIGRDVLLALTLPALRSRGLTGLPVTYIGKGATFALMSGFPLILLGHFPGLWSRVVLAIGWGFLIWGLASYLWSFVLYLIQFSMVLRQLPKVGADGSRGG